MPAKKYSACTLLERNFPYALIYIGICAVGSEKLLNTASLSKTKQQSSFCFESIHENRKALLI